MKNLIIDCTLFLVFIAFATAPAQWSNGRAADLVLGQIDMNTAARGRGADGMYAPTDVAIDPLTGKLFVADIANHRVLRWTSTASLTSGMPAEAVLGQTNFDTVSAATARNRMNFPTAVVVDAAGRLWVADAINNRVLRFDNASALPTGADAGGVLGQPDFISNAKNTTRNGMDYARGIEIDANGTLFVADQINNRVLRFDNAASKSDGADADGVLGQPDFTSNRDTATRSGMSRPRGLAVDPLGRLYVAASFQGRVLRFDNAASKPDGAMADAVLGQPDFTTVTPACARNSMNEPIGLALDASGRLYVSDYENNRLLWFDNAAAKPNGADADGVLGQPDFVEDSAAVTAAGMYTPWGVTVENEAGKLWVADAGNNRVLRYSADGPLSHAVSAPVSTDGFILYQNHPNPFGAASPSSAAYTTLEFSLERDMAVTLAVHDILGRQRAVLLDGESMAGSHRLRFEGDGLPGGVYLLTMTAKNGGGDLSSQSRLMTLLK